MTELTAKQNSLGITEHIERRSDQGLPRCLAKVSGYLPDFEAVMTMTVSRDWKDAIYTRFLKRVLHRDHSDCARRALLNNIAI